MKKQIIVFGDLPIATKVCEFLETLSDVEYKVVIGNLHPHNNDPWTETPLLKDYAEEHNIERLELEQLPLLFKTDELTLGLSCRYSVILKPDVIKLFKNGIINMHGGLIPEFRGTNICCHSIIEGSPIGGGTLHYIDEGIDTGEIIKRCEFPIGDDDTGYSVFQKTQMILYENLIQILPCAIERKLNTVTQQQLIAEGHVERYFSKKSLEKYKQLQIENLNSPFADRIIRAFDFPMHEPAYILVNGKKLYLKYTYN